MALDKLRDALKKLRPFSTTPKRTWDCGPAMPDGRREDWNQVRRTPQFATPLPPEAKGPIRAREARRKKGAEGY